MKSLPDAIAFLEYLRTTHADCCVDPHFSAIILEFANCETDEEIQERVQRVICFIWDILIHMTPSSIAVEKLHLITLQDTRQSTGQHPKTIQLNSYVSSARIQHHTIAQHATCMSVCGYIRVVWCQ